MRESSLFLICVRQNSTEKFKYVWLGISFSGSAAGSSTLPRRSDLDSPFEDPKNDQRKRTGPVPQFLRRRYPILSCYVNLTSVCGQAFPRPRLGVRDLIFDFDLSSDRFVRLFFKNASPGNQSGRRCTLRVKTKSVLCPRNSGQRGVYRNIRTSNLNGAGSRNLIFEKSG